MSQVTLNTSLNLALERMKINELNKIAAQIYATSQEIMKYLCKFTANKKYNIK